jgi:DNA-damage-inducible protein D
MAMNNDIQKTPASLFENLKHLTDDGIEYWTSRELSRALEYTDYRNFLLVIDKAKEACKNSGHRVLDHFVEFNEMVLIGSTARREIESVKLSRYACYLIVQNADPSKEIIAAGQTYFATQTRLQELRKSAEYHILDTEDARRVFLREEMRKHNVQLADAAKQAGVIDPIDYAIFQNHGYQGLYGGLGQKEIHAKKGLKKSQKILDHMGSEELAANLFRATQAESKLRRERIKGKKAANKAHLDVGAKVRQTIKELGGTMPENLPTADSIVKAAKRIQNQNTESLPPDSPVVETERSNRK